MTNSKIPDCGPTKRLTGEAEAIIDLMLREKQIFSFTLNAIATNLGSAAHSTISASACADQKNKWWSCQNLIILFSFGVYLFTTPAKAAALIAELLQQRESA